MTKRQTIGRCIAVIFGVAFVALNTFLHTTPSLDTDNNRQLHASHSNVESNNKSSGEQLLVDSDSIQVLREWRQTYQTQCQDQTSTREDLLHTLSTMVRPTSTTRSSSSAAAATTSSNSNQNIDKMIPCLYTILDFGANVGDSLGKFIDSGIDPCPQKGLLESPKFDLETATFSGDVYQRNNVLVKASREILHQIGGRHPEEYCYYGVEGNPHFTQRLQALEKRINSATPRPVQRAHFLTETVGAGHDGPTVLYLDTINTEQNFWGSSMLAGHRDVQRSATVKGQGKTSQVVQAPVQGITLSSLLRQSVLKQAGAHVLIKMDIEGGEYYVLEEAFQSGELCAYAQSGVQIHLIVETHRPDVIGMTNFDLQHWRHLKRSLEECGVILQTGRDAG